MDEPLAERSQRVLDLARNEALRLNHEYIGTEHILLGIIGGTTGVAAEVLGSLGVNLDGVRAGVESIIGIGPSSASPDDRGMTPRARRVIEFAREEAARRGNPEVDPEHLLIGVTREVEGVAAQVLRNLQIPPGSVHEQVSRLLG